MTKIISYLSLGSNMGDRMDYLDAAKEKIANNEKITLLEESRVYETEPWPKNGNDEHPHEESGKKWFLNQVVKVETSLGPEELLDEMQEIEIDLGRKSKHSWGPREIDIDILLFNEDVIDLPRLEIPHRHMLDRRFVLEPLVDIDSHVKDPITGKTYKYILDNLKDDHEVTPFL